MRTRFKLINIEPEEMERAVNDFLSIGNYKNVRIQSDLRKMEDGRYYAFAYITYEEE